jgi:hypothetical protein
MVRYSNFVKGFYDFLSAIAAWIIHLLGDTDATSIDFWLSLDSTGWWGWQSLCIFSKGYYYDSFDVFNTYPDKETMEKIRMGESDSIIK